MHILLLQDHDLGAEGEVVTVADVRTRDDLIARGIAAFATPEAVRAAEERAVVRREQSEHELEAMEQLAEDLDGMELHIVLHGVVGQQDIVRAAAAQGCVLQASWVHCDTVIAEAGEYAVRMELPHGLEAEVAVVVDAAEESS